MVKFFLKDDKNPPKLQKTQKQDKKQKNLKITDFRIVIWKKLFNLIKAQHSIMMQKIIRKIKDKKRKLEKISSNPNEQNVEQHSEKQQNPVGKNQNKISKKIQKLQKKYEQLKSIKKQELKKLTLYIITEVLKIENCDKIFEKYSMKKQDYVDQDHEIKNKKKDQEINESYEQVEPQKVKKPSKLKKTVQQTQSLKNFIEKLSMLTAYIKQLQKCAQLLDVVQEKKLLKKGKLKQKKQKKYQKEKLEKQGPSQANENTDKKQVENEQKKQQKTQEPKRAIKINNYFQRNNNYSNSFKKEENFKPFNRQNKFNKNQQNNKYHKFNKPIHKQKDGPKQRTQFKKTGRNKVKYEKEQQKNKFKNQNKFNQQAKPVINLKKAFLSYKKQQAHPSWQAKQELKQQATIRPFQGKKILL